MVFISINHYLQPIRKQPTANRQSQGQNAVTDSILPGWFEAWSLQRTGARGRCRARGRIELWLRPSPQATGRVPGTSGGFRPSRLALVDDVGGCKKAAGRQAHPDRLPHESSEPRRYSAQTQGCIPNLRVGEWADHETDYVEGQPQSPTNDGQSGHGSE